MATNRFDLEEALMACWSTADDINLIASNADELDDDLLNALNSVKILHERRLQRVFDLFETLIADRKL